MKETTLVLEGLAPEAVTAEFLTGVMDAAEAAGLEVVGVSVVREGESE